MKTTDAMAMQSQISNRKAGEVRGQPPGWFVVTMDTEADDAWAQPERVELSNMEWIEAFQCLSESYGIVPTYLVAYECATRDEAVTVLKPIADRNGCEIGHHLHAWTTPPFQNQGPQGIDRAWIQGFQFELPESLFAEKSHCLAETIEATYGKAPTSHRAGRWGADRRTFTWLERNGFIVDTSIIPLRSLEKKRGVRQRGPKYYSAPMCPGEAYAGSALIEVPVTVDVPGSLVGRMCAEHISREWPGTKAVARLFRGRLVSGGNSLSVNPRLSSETLRGMIFRSIMNGNRIVNLALHSSELALGTSPFSRTPEDLDRVWRNLKSIYKFVQHLGLSCVGLTDAASAWSVSQHLTAPTSAGEPISVPGGKNAFVRDPK